MTLKNLYRVSTNVYPDYLQLLLEMEHEVRLQCMTYRLAVSEQLQYVHVEYPSGNQ
jgi:hypothetical protein